MTKSVKTLAADSGLGEKRVKVIVAQLVGAGAVEQRRGGLVRASDEGPQVLERFLAGYEQRRLDDRERLEAMMRFAQSPVCRRKLLREYFGWEKGEACGACDNCRSGLADKASERPLIDRAVAPA